MAEKASSAATEPFEDEFDDAKSAYITMDDLDGRLALIWPTGIRENMPGANGKPYDAVEAQYVILDGDTAELIPAIPCKVDDGLFSAGAVVNKLKPRVKAKNPRPLLGRFDSRPSQQNKKVLAYGIAEPTDEDKAVARQYLAANPVNPFE